MRLSGVFPGWLQAEPRRSDAFVLAALGLLARLLVVAWAGTRFPPAEDGKYYHIVATRIAEGMGYTWLWPDGSVTYAAHYPIGYPSLVAAVYAVVGPHPVAAMLLNAAIGALGVFAVHRIAASSANRAGAVLAGVLVALHPSLVFYTPALMTEGVTAALLAVTGWLLVVSRKHPRAGTLALGLMLGLVTLVRPQSLLLAPLLGLLVPSGPGLGRRLLASASVAVLAVSVCLPWTLRNCERMDRCVFVSANAGWNLLIGAGEGATGSWVPLERVGVPKRCRSVFGEADKDACFRDAAVDIIVAQPGRWLALMPSKLAQTFDPAGAPGWYLHASNPKAFDERAKLWLSVWETFWMRTSLLLALLALGLAPGPRPRARMGVALLFGAFAFVRFAWVAHLGLVALALLLGRALVRHPPGALAAAAVAATAAVHATFFGAGRYSMVCFALLAALAGCVLRRPKPPAEAAKPPT